jgi:hypothetical protein
MIKNVGKLGDQNTLYVIIRNIMNVNNYFEYLNVQNTASELH